MFEPTILPIAISLSPLIAAVTLVTNSGKLVPIATIVNPITFSLTLNVIAILFAFSTTNSLPNFNNIIPRSISIVFLKILIFLLFSLENCKITSCWLRLAMIIVYVKNKQNNPISISPSYLFIFWLILHIIRKIKVKNIDMGFSINLVWFWNSNGRINADRPNISNKLHILLPIILPIEISEYPSIADVVLTNNSGIDVPIDTIVRPITISEICSFLAIAFEPSTRKSAPLISSVKPININNICINIFITLFNIFIVFFFYYCLFW